MIVHKIQDIKVLKGRKCWLYRQAYTITAENGNIPNSKHKTTKRAELIGFMFVSIPSRSITTKMTDS